MPRITVLLNTHAGRHDPSEQERVAAAFAATGHDVIVQPTSGAKVETDCARAIAGGSTVVVAGGGDGTVSAVASALAGSEVTLGVLPLGTLNHFAKDLGIPLDLEAAARTIAEHRTMLVDVGEVNGRCFVNNSSIGIYATLIAERDAQQRGGRAKWVAHGVAAGRVLRRHYRRLRVRLIGEGVDRFVRTPFVFVGNNQYQLSGFELGGRHRLTAGVLHVCMAPGLSRSGVWRMIVAAVLGRLHTIDHFESFPATAITLDVGAWQAQVTLDGEVLTMSNPLKYRIRQRSLRVIVPAE